ncbi:MAG: hypothetical protein QF741_04315 [Candidatus Peribacteraceae bacterium]|nr:hypothetical protein [Candidatus Peribacteraceae bacterium]MDP7453943.1 hypothetical protein [Candidatus Peribacteraceae bacterium]MDP7645590.1 hypothetical protein [Candidatus Peribacteraceae bacterium]|tara:strand:+ start:3013 stop:3645 length:633 start_codon:yes stop_codon:yes gene_type:complete
MNRSHTFRSGMSLIELIMFMAFFSVCAGVLINVLMSTNEQRVRQQMIAGVEQEGMQIMQTLTRRVRRAERIAYPLRGESGSVLSVQVAEQSQDPTIIALETGAIRVAEKNVLRNLSSEGLTITNLVFQNTSATSSNHSVRIIFTASKSTGLPTGGIYQREFQSLITLFPDDDLAGNPCACSTPTCVSDIFDWGYCDGENCVDSGEELLCE